MDQNKVSKQKTFLFTATSSFCTQNIAPTVLIIPCRPRQPAEGTLSAQIYAVSLSDSTYTDHNQHSSSLESYFTFFLIEMQVR